MRTLSRLLVAVPVLPVFIGLAALSGSLDAQTLTDIVPAAAEPGDLVVLRGTGLGTTTQVRFTGTVGGFVGIWNVPVAPTSVSATEVRAIVPTFNNFVGPSAVPPSSPFGSVAAVGGAMTPEVKFYFMEEKHGQVTTPGIGTTQSNGERAVCAFAIGNGEPVTDNPNFMPTLGLAATGAIPVLAVGHQASEPFFPIGDGTLTIDFASPIFVLLVGPMVGPDGSSSVALPIPKICAMPTGTTEDPVCGVPVALQWGMLDPVTLSLSVSNGMFVTL